MLRVYWWNKALCIGVCSPTEQQVDLGTFPRAGSESLYNVRRRVSLARWFVHPVQPIIDRSTAYRWAQPGAGGLQASYKCSPCRVASNSISSRGLPAPSQLSDSNLHGRRLWFDWPMKVTDNWFNVFFCFGPHRIHQMRTTAIDVPAAWASVNLPFTVQTRLNESSSCFLLIYSSLFTVKVAEQTA